MSENKIYTYIKNNNECRVSEISEFTGLSRQYIHRQLQTLIDENKIIKVGRPPKVFYRVAEELQAPSNDESSESDFLNKHFILFTEQGIRKEGVAALKHYCIKNKLPYQKTESEYIQTRHKYLHFYNDDGLIDGTYKIQHTAALHGDGLDKVYYGDFYAIERFGKTKLGWLIHIAKQTSNLNLMNEIIHMVTPQLKTIIQKEKIEAIGFIPPTIKREIQIMKVFEKKLSFNLPKIEIIKIKSQYMIPQKSLSTLEERISNARHSIVLGEKTKFDHILLIDDAIGSGATIFETAKKIKPLKLASKIIGYAVTGSYKGFEVIQGV